MITIIRIPRNDIGIHLSPYVIELCNAFECINNLQDLNPNPAPYIRRDLLQIYGAVGGEVLERAVSEPLGFRVP